MSKSPIDTILDSVEWVPLEWANKEPDDSDIPVATHSGILTLGKHSLRVYQLSNGMRIIDQADMIAFLEGGDVDAITSLADLEENE